jgi:membrane protein CcdC involved in cytochrome C biogenesis
VVAANLWKEAFAVLGLDFEISNMHTVTSMWNDRKKYKKRNMIFAAILRTIWIIRNDHVFNRVQLTDMQGMWRRLACSCAQWKILLEEEEK